MMIETTMTRDAVADSYKARKAMIDSQLRTSGVNEEFVLARMLAVPREDFLPAERRALAYIDRSIALSVGALAAPLFYGKVLVEAAPRPDDRALVVENGTGYLATLLRPLVASCDTVSVDAAASGAINGTFSLVIVDGAVERLGNGLVDAIADNGRIVSGLLLRQVTRLASGRRVLGQVALQPLEDLGIPVLHAFDVPKTWSFS
jgi:protein-L-isoaspartate(D-aspartate) O-methyltransferase